MELLAAHGAAIGAFDQYVRPIADDQWSLRTPDTDWTVRDLVNHLTAEQLWALELLAGKTVQDVGDAFDGDVLGVDPVDRWIDASVQSREAFLAPGALERVVHLSYGDVPGADYCAQMTFDLTVHAWDLGRALGRPDTELDAELVAWALGYALEQADVIAASSLFDDPVAVPDDAPDLSRLLALTGRRR